MKRYILLLSIILAMVARTYANDTLQREVTIVRNFTPVVRPADKINTLPPISAPQFHVAPVAYSFDAYSAEVAPALSTFDVPGVADNKDTFTRYNGYATFDMGMYMAMAANAGYSILDTTHDKLGVAARFTSLNGDVPVNTHAAYVTQDVTRQTYYDVGATVRYAHIFDNNLTLSAQASYRYIDFNYYGVMANPSSYAIQPMQQVNNYQAELRVDNNEARHYDYEKWHVVAGYGYYGNSNGLYTREGSCEHHAYIDASYAQMLGERWYVGGDVAIDYLHYMGMLSSSTPLEDVLSGKVAPATQSHNHFVLQLLPHAQWSRERMSLRLGAKVEISGGDGPVVYISPDVRYNWEFVKNYFLFATINGGKRLNTWGNMSQGCFYFDPSQPIASEFTAVDAQLGLRMRIIPDLAMTLYGGYEIADRALFQQIDGLTPTLTWCALDATCVKAGVHIEADITDYLTLSADAAYRQWQHDGRMITYHRPRWEANASVMVRPIAQLDVKLDYNMQLERDYGIYGKLADIHNLQLFATYRIFDWLSVSLHGNNLLNRRHDYYYGMPAPGIQVMAGVALKF